MSSILQKHLPLRSNSVRSQSLQEERKKDHYSHFILRLAFASTEDLRRRFSRLESMLFRLRFKDDDFQERNEFVRGLDLDWEEVGEDEKRELKDQLMAASALRKGEEQEWFKVDWERVPELVEQRRVLIKRGKAYVPQREQMSLVVAEFTKRLDDALQVCQSPRHQHLIALTLIVAHGTRSPSSGRRRPPRAHSRSPFPIFQRPRICLYILRRRHRRPLGDPRKLHRHTVQELPSLHAEPPHELARKFASEVSWSLPVHIVPQRHRPQP